MLAFIIPIPIGTKHVAAVRGAVWKLVSCATCQQGYAYLLELEATGEDHDMLFLDGEGSAGRARANAEDNLSQQMRNVVLPIPCPNCGSYQEEMSRQLKDEASINSLQVAGLLLSATSIIPPIIGTAYCWPMAIVLAVAGLSLIVYGVVIALRFDPNAGDPEARKRLGRSHAICGEQLSQLLATKPSAERGGEHNLW
jgi:hypothetical protein